MVISLFDSVSPGTNLGYCILLENTRQTAILLSVTLLTVQTVSSIVQGQTCTGGRVQKEKMKERNAVR